MGSLRSYLLVFDLLHSFDSGKIQGRWVFGGILGRSPLFWRLRLLSLFTRGFQKIPIFMGGVVATSLLWAISDVVYFRSVPVVGAGVLSRLLPSAVIISFVLWFFLDPALLQKYLGRPWQAAALCAVILISVFLTTMIRRCSVSWQAVRLIWFNVFAAAIGPAIIKKFDAMRLCKRSIHRGVSIIEEEKNGLFWGPFLMFDKK